MSFFDTLPEQYPCPICGELCAIKESKKKKPYYFCDPCGVQVFIRGKSGINQLIEIKNNSELLDKLKYSTITDTSELLKLNQRIILIKSEIEKLNRNEFNLPENDFETRHRNLTDKLEALETAYHSLLVGRADNPLSVAKDEV